MSRDNWHKNRIDDNRYFINFLSSAIMRTKIPWQSLRSVVSVFLRMQSFLVYCSAIMLFSVLAFNETNASCCCIQNNCCVSQTTQKCDCCNTTKEVNCDCAAPQHCNCTTTTPEVVAVPSAPVAPSVNQSSDITINNTLSNRNEIHVPITISNVNTFNFPSRQPVPTSAPYKSSTIDILPTFVTATAAPATTPKPNPDRCCNVIVPCVGDGCQMNYRICSNICVNHYMYLPVNPCARHPCYRQDYYSGYMCSSSPYYPYINCGIRQRNCDQCNSDFYQDFYTYSRCSACFHYWEKCPYNHNVTEYLISETCADIFMICLPKIIDQKIKELYSTFLKFLF